MRRPGVKIRPFYRFSRIDSGCLAEAQIVVALKGYS